MLVIVSTSRYNLDPSYYNKTIQKKDLIIADVPPDNVKDYILLSPTKSVRVSGSHTSRLIPNYTIHPSKWKRKEVKFNNNISSVLISPRSITMAVQFSKN